MPGETFLAALNELHRDAGRPSYRAISRATHRGAGMPATVSHPTVGDLLRGKTLSSWPIVESVVRCLAERDVQHRRDVEEEVRRLFALWSDAVDS